MHHERIYSVRWYKVKVNLPIFNSERFPEKFLHFAGQAAVLLLPSRAVPTQTFFPLKRDGNKCELEISNLSSMLH